MHPLEKIAPYYKAAAALLIALLSGLITGLVSGGLDWTEILVAIVAMLTAGITVFKVPNIPAAIPSANIPPITTTTSGTATTTKSKKRKA
jgi:hypothetical protein